MEVIDTTSEGVISLPAKELKPQFGKALSSLLAQKILKQLVEEPCYPKLLAKKLKVHEQKIYYHIRQLEKAQIIEVVKNEAVHGTIANFYALTKPAFFIKFKEFEQARAQKSATGKEFLEPFVEDGRLNARIIVGSPDPHGPEMARSRDGYYGIDLGLFLGTFLNSVNSLKVKLDTEVRSEDLKGNLILLGGPVINNITWKINDKMPIYFDAKNNWAIRSKISKQVYHSDETGVILKMKNPFNPKKQLMLVAGKRYQGTRAVMIAFLKYFDKITVPNKYNPKFFAKVVEGRDKDADGIIDDIVVLE